MLRLRTSPALPVLCTLLACSRPAREPPAETASPPAARGAPPPAAAPAPRQAPAAPAAPATPPVGAVAVLSTTSFHSWPVVDRQQGGLSVGTFAVPEGWIATSAVEWTYANTSWPVQIAARIAAPDGSAWVESFPGECFYWTEPADRATPVGAKNLGMVHQPGLGTANAMAWLILRHRGGAPGLKVVGSRPIPNLAAALGKPPVPGDSLAARIRWEQAGHAVDEELFLLLAGERVPYRGPMGTSFENHRFLTYAHSMGARDGRLDGLHPLLGFIAASFRPDPVWAQHRAAIQAALQAQFDRNIAAGYSRIAAAAALSRQISANNDRMSAMRDAQRAARDAAQDRIHDNFTQYLRGTERMADPYWGTSEHSYTERYHWTDGQGNYRHSNDPNFDPNVGGTGSWRLMEPAR